MSRKLFLHIGNHKTGTTSIQESLHQNRQYLSEQGYGLLEHMNANNWITFNETDYPEAITTSIEDKEGFARAVSSSGNNPILSAENFSWMYYLEELQELGSALRYHFDDIYIVAYIRRQDQQAISYHQQNSKNMSLPSRLKFFGSDPVALPEYQQHHARYLDYNQRIGKWADVFGDENIQIRVFDRKHLIDGDVVKDFCHLVGVKLDTVVETNISRSLAAVKIGHLLNELSITNFKMRSDLPKALEYGDKMLPSREQAETYYSHFRESNIALNNRFRITELPSIFDEDFSNYPEHRTDLWDEDKANEAIKRILQLYSELATARELADTRELHVKRSARNRLKKSLAKLRQSPKKYILDKFGSS